MVWQKGNSGNPNGKPIGAKSVKTEQWEIFKDFFLNQGLAKFTDEMNKLEGRDYIETSVKLLEYFKPKLARTEVMGENGKAINIQILDYGLSDRIAGQTTESGDIV